MSIQTVKDLEAWQDSVEKRLGTAWANQYKSGPDHSKAYADLGKLAKGIAKNDTETLTRWGFEHKANVGTPLYSDATTGSYLTTPEISAAIKYAAYQSSVLVPRVEHTPMGNRQKQLPVASTMVSLTWQALQSSGFTEVSPTFDQKTLTAYSCGAFACVTESLLEDDDTTLGAYLVDTFGNYLGYELDYQIARGVTVPWAGILGSATYNVNLDTGNTSFTDVGWDDLKAAMDKLGTERWCRGGVYCFHPTVVAALRTKKNANGDYVLRDVANSTIPQFLGYPVLACDAIRRALRPHRPSLVSREPPLLHHGR